MVIHAVTDALRWINLLLLADLGHAQSVGPGQMWGRRSHVVQEMAELPGRSVQGPSFRILSPDSC